MQAFNSTSYNNLNNKQIISASVDELVLIYFLFVPRDFVIYLSNALRSAPYTKLAASRGLHARPSLFFRSP